MDSYNPRMGTPAHLKQWGDSRNCKYLDQVRTSKDLAVEEFEGGSGKVDLSEPMFIRNTRVHRSAVDGWKDAEAWLGQLKAIFDAPCGSCAGECKIRSLRLLTGKDDEDQEDSGGVAEAGHIQEVSFANAQELPYMQAYLCQQDLQEVLDTFHVAGKEMLPPGMSPAKREKSSIVFLSQQVPIYSDFVAIMLAH
jgi:hypothetical protein